MMEDDQLTAGEYVLGVLDQEARQVFQKKLESSAKLQQYVDAWEQHFVDINQSTEPVTPPADILPAIHKRLGFKVVAETTARRWRRIAMVTSFASVLLLSVLIYQNRILDSEAISGSYTVVVRNDAQQPLWLIDLNWQTGQLAVESIVQQPVMPDHDYELWLLGAEGEAPVSLGVLPAASRQQSFKVSQKREITATALAVSYEPKGGSTTGLPTGPVLYVQPLVPKQT